MASALWEAAKAGNSAEASRLLDARAPVEWKCDVNVSAWCQGVRYSQTRAPLQQVELSHHRPHTGITGGPWTAVATGAVSWRVPPVGFQVVAPVA